MKTVIITGASGDIGFSSCKAFLQNGYNVVAVYNSNSVRPLEEYAKNSKVLYVKADVSKKQDVKNLFCTAYESFGSIDVVINNAAISLTGVFQDMTEEELNKIIDVNIKGVFYVSQTASEYMIKEKSGSIINISSMWGEVGASCEAAYSMTKSAVIGLTKALSKELGPSNIRVNCVSPGFIDTKMNAAYTKEDISAICEDTPLMRIGKPEEVADALIFLADSKASFITGQVLGVNGGYVI